MTGCSSAQNEGPAKPILPVYPNSKQPNSKPKPSGKTNTTGPALHFGGMYSERNGYKNPATNDFSCPSEYSSIQILGSAGEDAELFACLQAALSNTQSVFEFGGLYGYHADGNYDNPITNSTSCPVGFRSTQVYGGSAAQQPGAHFGDHDLYLCYRNADEDSHQYGLGGFFGKNREDETAYPNFLTGTMNCPADHLAYQTLGSSDQDWPLSFCVQALGTSRALEPRSDPDPNVSFTYDLLPRGRLGFGGMYSAPHSTAAPNNSDLGINPATGARSCPEGYKEQQVLGRDGVNNQYWEDWDLYFCYIDDQGLADTAVYDFGGVYGMGDNEGRLIYYNNPITGEQSCPENFIAKQVLQLGNLPQLTDHPLFYCYREQLLDEPTPYSFAGLYSELMPNMRTPSRPGAYANYQDDSACEEGSIESMVRKAWHGNIERDPILYMCHSEL